MNWTAFITGSALLLFFLVSFWPKRGFYFHWQRWHQLDSRETIEDALMHLHQRQHEGRLASTESLAGLLGVSTKRVLVLVQRMESQQLLSVTGEGLYLSQKGHRWALQVVRAHRLFERYLADETSIPMREIHQYAHRLEHRLSTQELDKLDAELGYPTSDPHGDPIPTATGELPAVEHQSLVDWEVGKSAQIVHIEDEPPAVYAQIVAEGLALGMIVTIIDTTSTRIVIESSDMEYVLAPVVAANISVREAPESVPTTPMMQLTELKMGEKARVLALDNTCQGLMRRRFLDLGITPGTLIEPVMRSAFRDPTAYRVRDTLIALRRDQTDLIFIETAA